MFSMFLYNKAKWKLSWEYKVIIKQWMELYKRVKCTDQIIKLNIKKKKY